MTIKSAIDQVDRGRRNQYLYEGLNLEESKSVKLWEQAGIKLREANLTADQIGQLFKSVEQGSSAAGGNRTLIGQGKDAATAVNKAWNDLKGKIQNSAPIKNADAAYDSAVAKIEQGLGGPNNAVNQLIQKYRAFAKAHPVAQGFIYAALIAAAGISGAGLGGAATLGLLKMADKLLQGEKFSSAAYSGAKTGAVAYGAGQVGQALQGEPQASAPALSGRELYQSIMKGGLDAANQAIQSGQVTDYNSAVEMADNIVDKFGTGFKNEQSRETMRNMVRDKLLASLNRGAAKESVSFTESQIQTLFYVNRRFWDTRRIYGQDQTGRSEFNHKDYC